jgi:hypothetical protein
MSRRTHHCSLITLLTPVALGATSGKAYFGGRFTRRPTSLTTRQMSMGSKLHEMTTITITRHCGAYKSLYSAT